MKAIQYWTLLEYLPLALGKHISKYSEFLLHLSQIVGLIFFHLNLLYLKEVIDEHLATFSDLYSSSQWEV
jgi:hypothetical protein